MDSRLGRAPPESPLVETTVEDDRSTSYVVINAVAAVSGMPVGALPPLADRIDPDALDRLFPDDGTRGNVVFSYDDYTVVVTADERVEVYDTESVGLPAGANTV